jgi:hypothetical protein
MGERKLPLFKRISMPLAINPKFISQDMTTDAELDLVESGLQTQITNINNNSPFPNMIFVNEKSDFPAAVSDVITLADNVTYFITTTVDLTGSRLVAGQNTTIIGGSSESCYLISTGLSSSTALITSNYSLPMRNVSITHGTALDLDGTGNASAALDWFGVNFVNCAIVGTIKTYSNFIMTDCALLNSANMKFDGTIATVGFLQCIFSGIAGQKTLEFPSTLTITRRIRVTLSSFIAFGGATGIHVSPSVVFSGGAENYILLYCNFSGGATYVGGTDYTSNNALFQNCKGITNSSNQAQMYFTNNATPTPIATQSVFEKAEGTTTVGGINQKFTHTIGRLTYTGGITKEFVITTTCAINSVSDASIIILARIAKNGATIPESEYQITTSGAKMDEHLDCQAVVVLAQNDYIELYVANDTSASSIIVTELNLSVRASG